jgi:hypothetical protein
MEWSDEGQNMIKSMICFAFRICCLCLTACFFFFLFFFWPVSAAQPSPTVEVESLLPAEKSPVPDKLIASFRKGKLCIAIHHRKGIGRTRVVLREHSQRLGNFVSGSSSSRDTSVPVEVRFINFAMLEGFTAGSGDREIYTLSASRAKERKFLLRVPMSSGSATIDLAWVDAYR